MPHSHTDFGRMQPLSKSWYVWIMALLLLAQVVLSVNYHVLICNMPIANTLLLVIIMVHNGYMGNQARPLFHRICGCVAFIAVLFVNTTHAMELLTDYGQGHSHGGDDHDEEHDDHYAFVPKPYVYVSIFDVILKCLVLVLGHVPAMGLPLPLRFILHTLSPLVVIGFYVLGITIPHSIGEMWIWKNADPIAAVCMTVLFAFLIFPAFKELMPYVFAETPRKFDQDVFQLKISTAFNDVRCTHIHAYRLWPGNQFEALIHLNIKVNKQSEWVEEAEERYINIKNYVHVLLSDKGARRIVIEPRFIDTTEEDVDWVGCVADKCHKNDKGCCAVENGSSSSP